MKIVLTLLLLVTTQSLFAVRCGAERLDKLLPHINGKRVALIINHTSTLSPNHTLLLDTLISCGVDVRRVFAPEHGFRGTADAGETVVDGRDVKSGVEIVSLYGQTKRPTKEHLKDVDVVVFDIQDVGARFYTYISTMYYAMQSCAEFHRDFIVLDRPNPNDHIAGAVISEELFSFVGALPIPTLHGLTVAELALMIQGQGWLGGHDIDLEVIPMTGWRHGQPYDLPIKPSPNLPTSQSVALYPSLCLFEATQVSVGRGTTMPFEVVGYPDKRYGDFLFTPRAMKGWDSNPLQLNKECWGLDLRGVAPPQNGFTLRYFIDFMRLSGEGAEFITRTRFFDLLCGDPTLRDRLARGVSEAQIFAEWDSALVNYRVMRSKYLLYDDN